MQAAQRLDIRVQAVGARLQRMETAVARLQNHNVNAPDDAIIPIPGAVAPFALPADAVPPVHCPPNLEALSRLSTLQASVGQGVAPLEDVSSAQPSCPLPLQCTILLAHFALLALPPPAIVGHGAGAAAAVAAANRAALVAGIERIGRHLGVPMADSWKQTMQRDTQRALNASATVAAHSLLPLSGPYPPFGLPLLFPTTAGAFRAMLLADARTLCAFYALPYPPAGDAHVDELGLRRAALAKHVGFRE